ncbi:MAG: hypothetical protein MR534_02530 [Prevotellaceae bacterium]|nr:hypothetical protein [Prevotellaceae bacterium]MDD7658246.1 hypothetical protein [Prevotellaceae bacterium]
MRCDDRRNALQQPMQYAATADAPHCVKRPRIQPAGEKPVPHLPLTTVRYV